EVLAADRTAEPREEAVAGGDDADPLAVLRLPVVERGGVLEPVPLALADDAQAVVRGERVLHDPEHRFVEREVHPLPARRRARLPRAPLALPERGDDRERVEDTGQVVGDDDAG